ncbi:RHO1 GDP-GTP exchange protein 2 [Lunasporangiospora selenospora]|uniref:RHO1 GDP-GTP exchange protein 2 n=1 Tax=Lunasporangiospora selenospora TaxID=979761 RepID=A0A9P6FUY6_9FUNG|nr:RHO1 GDP-GTP exchange protein 2 [Lunasporangiospora selenospora]
MASYYLPQDPPPPPAQVPRTNSQESNSSTWSSSGSPHRIDMQNQGYAHTSADGRRATWSGETMSIIHGADQLPHPPLPRSRSTYGAQSQFGATTPQPELPRSSRGSFKDRASPQMQQQLAQQLKYQRTLAMITQEEDSDNNYDDGDKEEEEDEDKDKDLVSMKPLPALPCTQDAAPDHGSPTLSQPRSARSAPASTPALRLEHTPVNPSLSSFVQQPQPQQPYQSPQHPHQHPHQHLQQHQQHCPQPHQSTFNDMRLSAEHSTNPYHITPSQQIPQNTTPTFLSKRSSTGSSNLSTQWSQASTPTTPTFSYTGTQPPSYQGPLQHRLSLERSPYLALPAQSLINFHPGILSTIAVAFREKMLQNEIKRQESEYYGLEFPVTFTGKEAVDLIIELVKIEDRRYALSIARSMESQKLFFGGGNSHLFDSNNDQYFFSDATLAYLPGKSDFPTVPRAVFPNSAPCYSFGCAPGNTGCYSYSCPNKNPKGGALGRQNSAASSSSGHEKVWANSVHPSVLARATKSERSRQEAIFEVINTEHNYVRDLELLEEIFINPLRSSNIIEPERLEDFIEAVFLNYKEILELNRKMLEALRVRQEQQPLVENFGDILLSHAVGFEKAYSHFIPRIVLSEFTSKREEATNPKFQRFLDECVRHPEARRLELRHFIGQPYQRIPRYPLLLREVVRRTDESVPDRAVVEEVIKVCSELGRQIDSCMPEGHRRVRLLTLPDKISWKSGTPRQDLKLTEKSRKLHFECVAKRRVNVEVQTMDVRLFLFDHLLLVTREKRDRHGDKESMIYRVSRHPIPLELVNIVSDESTSEAYGRESGTSKKPGNSSKTMLTGPRALTHADQPEIGTVMGLPDSRNTSLVVLEHQGGRGDLYTFFMSPNDKDEFMKELKALQAARRQAVTGNRLFDFETVTEIQSSPTASGVPSGINSMYGRRIICTATYYNVLDGKTRIVIGTDDGIFVGMENDSGNYRQVIKDISVSQISVLDSYHIMVVMTGKYVKAFNLSCLEPNADKSLQLGQVIGKNIQFFTSGQCAGKTLVIMMKKKGTSESQFVVYEPCDNAVLNSQQRTGFSLSFGKSGKSDWFKLYKEFTVASEAYRVLMLATVICVVCAKGFEVISLEDLEQTQIFPPRHNPAFSFIEERPTSVPMSMFKVDSGQFLMCYSDFAFIMSKKGELSRKGLIEWEGCPESFAMVYPYVIAFESRLIEVRHIHTGQLEQLILGEDIRLLYSDVNLKGASVIQIHKSDASRPNLQQVVKLVKTWSQAKPLDDTTEAPVAYKRRSTPPNSMRRPVSVDVTTATFMTTTVSPTVPALTSPNFSRHEIITPQHPSIQPSTIPPPIPQRPTFVSNNAYGTYPVMSVSMGSSLPSSTLVDLNGNPLGGSIQPPTSFGPSSHQILMMPSTAPHPYLPSAHLGYPVVYPIPEPEENGAVVGFP